MSKEEKVKTIIQEVLNVDIIEVTNSAHLKDDLGANESQLAEIINRIEATFSIILGFESFEMTVEDLLIIVLSEIQEESYKLPDKPRPLHYAFAHQVIPALVFNEGINLFWELRFKRGHDYMQGYPFFSDVDSRDKPAKQGLEYLNDLWNGLTRDLGNETIDPKGLDYEILEKSNRLIILFHFPEPLVAGEAFYSLFVLNNNVQIGETTQYFTFELCNGNKALIGQWTEDGLHKNHGSYKQVLTPKQFLDEVLKNLLPREDKSIIDEKKDVSSANPQFLVDGLFEKEHIYLKILLAISHKLNVPADQINQKTPIDDLAKQDFMDIIGDIYRMYDIDPKKHYLFIKQDVDRLVKCKNEQRLNCFLMLKRICQHFENRIAGDYDNPKALYLDYRKKIDLISQSSDFKILYNFICKTYPSFITDNADQKMIENKRMLFREILTIPDIHLSHNYPIDPEGLFICLASVAIVHSRFKHSKEKAAKYLDVAIALNTKWGPFVKPVILESIIHQPMRKMAKKSALNVFWNTISGWLK